MKGSFNACQNFNSYLRKTKLFLIFLMSQIFNFRKQIKITYPGPYFTKMILSCKIDSVIGRKTSSFFGFAATATVSASANSATVKRTGQRDPVDS